MNDSTRAVPLGEHIPVGVIIETGPARNSRWATSVHHLSGVVCGEAMRAPEPQSLLMRSEGEQSQHLWKGFQVHLHRDAAESYRYNLTAPEPMLFVVCREQEDGFRPVLVTVDHNEADSHVEFDDQVLSIALPPELHALLEAFVVQHYRPMPFKKRRRRGWGKDEQSG